MQQSQTPDLQAIAEQFVTAYYTAMEQDKALMLGFYTEDSIMTFEGEHSKGLKAIAAKIESFGFKKIVHKIDNLDVHPSPVPGAILCLVTGILGMDDENEFRFVQSFQLLPNAQGGYFCANDILRLFLA